MRILCPPPVVKTDGSRFSQSPRSLKRGLYLPVMPNGRKYWRMRYSWRGKENTLAFGVYPDVSLIDEQPARSDMALEAFRFCVHQGVL